MGEIDITKEEFGAKSFIINGVIYTTSKQFISSNHSFIFDIDRNEPIKNAAQLLKICKEPIDNLTLSILFPNLDQDIKDSILTNGGVLDITESFFYNSSESTRQIMKSIFDYDDDMMSNIRFLLELFSLNNIADFSPNNPNIVKAVPKVIFLKGNMNNIHISFMMDKIDNDQNLRHEYERINKLILPKLKLKATKKVIENLIPIGDSIDMISAMPNKLVHRDIKPTNIFMNETNPNYNHLVLGDLGLVIINQDSMGIALGSPMFVSPEVALSSRSATRKSDIYGLSKVIAYFLGGIDSITSTKGDIPLEIVMININEESFTELSKKIQRRLGIDERDADMISSILEMGGNKDEKIRLSDCRFMIKLINDILQKDANYSIASKVIDYMNSGSMDVDTLRDKATDLHQSLLETGYLDDSFQFSNLSGIDNIRFFFSMIDERNSLIKSKNRYRLKKEVTESTPIYLLTLLQSLKKHLVKFILK